MSRYVMKGCISRSNFLASIA